MASAFSLTKKWRAFSLPKQEEVHLVCPQRFLQLVILQLQ